MGDSKSFRVVLLEELCGRKHHLIFGFSATILLLALSIVSIVVVRPGTATYVVAVMNAVTLTVLLVVISGLITLCSRREY